MSFGAQQSGLYRGGGGVLTSGVAFMRGSSVDAHCSILLIHFQTPTKDNLSTKDTIAGPKVSFIQRFHCTHLYVCLQHGKL